MENGCSPNIHNSVTGDLAGAMFPAIFYDGEREIDMGSILITTFMNFKSFQSLISNKIGISPHQITTYFTPIIHQSNHHQRQRRHPVTSKFNFAAAISAAGSYLFWVVLKRSRRARRRNLRPITAVAVTPPPQPLPFLLLRRDTPVWDQELERYLMSLNLNSHVYSDLRGNFVNNYGNDGSNEMTSSEDCGGSSSGGSSSVMVFCEVCLNAKNDGDETVPFHWCKNDPITLDFRSRAGPIGPPAKK